MPANEPDGVSALAHVTLFAELSKQLGKLAKNTRAIAHKPGAEVTAQERGGLAFHAIVDGIATVEVNGVVRRHLGPGDYFGEISMIDGQPRSATVRAGTTACARSRSTGRASSR